MTPIPQPEPLPNRPLVPLATKPDYERCLERIEAWFHQAVIDRPPVRFHRHNAQFNAAKPLDCTRWKSFEERWLDTGYQIESFEASLAGRTFHAETFPMYFPNLGPSVYSAFYGGRLEFADITSWFDPVVTDLDDLSALQGDPFTSAYFRKLDEMTETALARAGDRYWVGYTDMHPGLDCISAWCGIEPLCITMITEPERLAPLVELSARDFRRIFDHFHARLQAAGQPSVTWVDIPCRGKFHIPSCDASSMISPEHFAEFALPQIRREMDGIDRAVFHVDGKGVARHLDAILALPGVQAIQWVQGLGADWPILQWMPLLRRILSAGKSVQVDVPFEELEDFITQMPREGLFLRVGVPPGEEERVLQRIERW